MSKRLFPIIRKEFIHIIRDFRTLVIIFAMPVFMLLMFGYAINNELQNIDLVAVDYSGTPESRELLRAFEGSNYFTIHREMAVPNRVHQLFQARRAEVALFVPHDFAQTLESQAFTSVQIVIDASDSNTGQLVGNYVEMVLQSFALERGLHPPFDIKVSIQYNPSLESTYFFVPGLVALILMMISALLTSIAITREKETGTMEQILVSPVRPAEIIVGKVVPYIVLAFMDGVLILLVAHFWFEVPIVGSVVLMLGAALLYVIVALALGLLISTKAKTQQVAMLAALIVSLLPTLMLSGFIFPLNSMPLPLQFISRIVPATYFLKVIRGVMLKGNGLAEIGTMIVVLGIMGVVLLGVSVKRFRMTL